MNDAALEAVLVQQLELGPDLIRQRALSATDEDWAEEQVAFVDQARGHGLASELRTADRDVAGSGLLELPDRRGIEFGLDPRPRARHRPERPREHDLLRRPPELREVLGHRRLIGAGAH